MEHVETLTKSEKAAIHMHNYTGIEVSTTLAYNTIKKQNT